MIQQFSVHIWAIGLRDWDLIESASLVLENSLNQISESRWEGGGGEGGGSSALQREGNQKYIEGHISSVAVLASPKATTLLLFFS